MDAKIITIGNSTFNVAAFKGYDKERFLKEYRLIPIGVSIEVAWSIIEDHLTAFGDKEEKNITNNKIAKVKMKTK